MLKIKFLILAIYLASSFRNGYAQNCPFPSCSKSGSMSCEVECVGELPDVGDVKSMDTLTLTNFTSFSDDFLTGLEISNLVVDASQLSQISDHAFRGVSGLVKITFKNLNDATLISSNYLADLKDSLDTVHVAESSLDDASIDSIVSQLTVLDNFKYLAFPNNNLSSLSLNVSSLEKLVEVDLSYNLLESVSIEGGLSVITLNSNKIKSLDDINLITPRLLGIYVEYNSITSLPEDVFSSLNIQFLSFAYNNISQIDSKAFTNLNSLYWVKLSGNSLTGLTLSFPNSVTDLYMDNCEFGNFKTNDLGVSSLKNLGLSYNNIDELPNDFFELSRTLNLLI